MHEEVSPATESSREVAELREQRELEARGQNCREGVVVACVPRLPAEVRARVRHAAARRTRGARRPVRGGRRTLTPVRHGVFRVRLADPTYGDVQSTTRQLVATVVRAAAVFPTRAPSR